MRIPILLPLVVIGVAGCDSIRGELSRNQAEDLVRTALAEYVGQKLFVRCVDRETMNSELRARGYADLKDLTETGQALMENFSWGVGLLSLKGTMGAELVEVTGIVESSSPKHKQVEFDWTFVGVPIELASLHAAGGKGTLQVARYDDGWRVQEMPGRGALDLEADESRCMQSGK
jgi:hypothetical protein